MDVLTQSLDWTRNWIEATHESAAPVTMSVGPAIVDGHTGLVEVNGTIQKLRRKELALLVYLHEHISTTFTRHELLRQVWRWESNIVTRTVDQTVATLRRKIGDDPHAPKYLLTIYGVGYQLSAAARS